MSGVEGVGDLVTGGLIAGAVEPAAGSESRSRDGECLNCGTGLTGPFCQMCGQKARVHRSLLGFLRDLIHGLFNFEGKIWRTLPMLAWRPGEMTRRYVEGQRARFVSPVALYLFTVFLMFAVLNFSGTLGSGPNPVRSTLAAAAADERAALARLHERRKTELERGADVGAIDGAIAAKTEDVAQIERVRTGDLVEVKGLEENDAPRWVREAVVRVQRDPEGFIRKVQDAASKFSWLLIPLSVPFLWLLFPFSRYHLYDHTVFVTYSLSFMMTLVIAGGLLVSLGAASLASMLFFLPPVHMYRQLRGAYSLSRINALLRTIVLMIFSFVVTTLFFLAMLAIGLFD